MEDRIKILAVRVGAPVVQEEIANTLESVQAFVKGSIEAVQIELGLLLICNEEGKINGLPANRPILGDIICGDFFLCGENEEGDLESVPTDKIEYYTRMYNDLMFVPKPTA